jgi:hypothetical protein
MADTTDTDDGRTGFAPLPSAAHAAAWATPFPDFDAAGEWEPKAAVHDFNVDQMQRLTEAERSA